MVGKEKAKKMCDPKVSPTAVVDMICSSEEMRDKLSICDYWRNPQQWNKQQKQLRKVFNDMNNDGNKVDPRLKKNLCNLKAGKTT